MTDEKISYPDVTRYCFYRVHKFMSALLSDFEQKVAVADFTNAEDVTKITKGFSEIKKFVFDHAKYEDNTLHQPLRDHKSKVHEIIEKEHHDYSAIFEKMESVLQDIQNSQNDINRCKQKGYEFYLEYRNFCGINLQHLYEEETLVLPELQQLCSDEEMRKVGTGIYNIINSEQIFGMLKASFPKFNYWDKEAFLLDIKLSQPDKFSEIWPKIEEIVSAEDMDRLRNFLDMPASPQEMGRSNVS